MKTFIKPIALNERSHQVNLLHKVLQALGTPVVNSEVVRGEAGEDTLRKVRRLQARLNVPVDESVLLDEATALAVEEALKERGLTAANRSFIVSGAVRLQDGTLKKRQRLLAFDLDLRGIAIFRTARTLAELQKNGGYEYLGDAVSDDTGNYRLTFYDWQYEKAERKKADVVVYAVEREEIIGRSRLVNSEDYSDQGLIRNLDVYVEQEEEGTEYERLMGRLNPFLRESEATLTDIASSPDHLIFIAGELDVELSLINIVAGAQLLVKQQEDKRLSHELLYGIGRQNIRLTWPALYKKREEGLRRAVSASIEGRIIREFSEEEIAAFLKTLRDCAEQYRLDDETEAGRALNMLLKNALPEESQRHSFLRALSDFKGNDFREFWSEHLPARPEFQANPELVSNLLFTEQLILLSGSHQTLIDELQVNRNIGSVRQLMELESGDWLEVIKKSGVPDFIGGRSEDEKVERYAGLVQNLLNAAFPTGRILRMLEKDELPIEKTTVAKAVRTFLSQNEQFDFATSRVHDFGEAIEEVANGDSQEVGAELMKIQRVFQVSTHPDALKALMANKLHSAYSIAGIPRKSFVKTYADALGGEQTALAIHQRASHISTRAEMNAMHMMEYAYAVAPGYALGSAGFGDATKALENQVPNYAELFGSPDICECRHCRSVYSAAAYFVDLLRFLWRGQPNDDGKTPLDMLAARRPDLLHLPLTCKNTNTPIPYIDLANEVMEYFTIHDSLTDYKGYDTGEATAGELGANPQNFNLEAYRKLNDAKFPFSLPYHQPLDQIRTYSGYLNVSRYEALKTMHPAPAPQTVRAVEAESLGISQETYLILTGEAFDGTADATPLHEYFGYAAASDMENLSAVREFLHRSGTAYTDLIELVKTRFVNPYQEVLAFLEKLFSYASIDAATIYSKLEQIEIGTLDPATDTDISTALSDYNSNHGTSLTSGELAQWVTEHLDEFRQVITLYEGESKCDLNSTRLRTLQSIYESSQTSGVTNDTWSKMHRFIRLWRQLDWTLYELDLVLAALGEKDITPATIGKLESVSLIATESRRPLNELAVLWGSIDTYGDKSLYKKLFLNRAVQQIDEAFKADAFGHYLQDASEILADHKVALLAAFRAREEDLEAVFQVARVLDGGKLRALDPDTDVLNIENLSTLYRHVALAKALKMKVTDLCRLISLFDASPFSIWDIQQQAFSSSPPRETYTFYKIASATKSAGFKSSDLEYILQGTVPAGTRLGLDKGVILQTARTVRAAFSTIEQDHPEVPEAPLTSDMVATKLALTFAPEIISRFIGILEGTELFETVTEDNLDISIPSALAEKYIYIKGSGRLTCAGVMTDAEQNALKSLANAGVDFQNAVDELYGAPEVFINDHFNGIFGDLAGAHATLLDHPAQATAAGLGEKLSYVYHHFLPILKSKLRRDVVTQHIATLTALSQESTALLVSDDIDKLIADFSSRGFSATYFSDTNWTTSVLERSDPTIDFAWETDPPDPLVPADSFSVRWKAYLAAPASGEYTLVVEVEEPDEILKLYLDEKLILEKTAADADTSLEVVTQLNATQMHLLTLEYAETSQDAGVRLLWKTATRGLEVIPPSVTYPAAILDDFAEEAATFHRAAAFILGFGISEAELAHFINHPADFDDINFKALKALHWIRISEYMNLRNAVPQVQALLTDVFALAATVDPAPTIDELTERLHLACAWDRGNLDYLVTTHFNLTVEDFKNEIAMKRLHEVMQIVSRTGLSPRTIAEWGSAETDFDALYATSQLIKSGVKAKYEDEDWLNLAGNLSDAIRENQQRALVSYLLTRPAIYQTGVRDADGLFEYFLIDVQMTACMDTSRVVQASAAVQMFINRCLLNLESDLSSGSEQGVSPGAIDKDRWEWMKNYRVWEANRKVFLYPENWLEPEWRNDRSEFFKELESYLVQNDITERSVEQAFRNYLGRLNQVANLEVCGMYREEFEDGKLKCLHLFARTHNPPYQFFYRRWDEYRKWSAWESVPVDIRTVDQGDHSGVHLIPVLWKKRFFLFWPEFMELPQPPPGNMDTSVADAENSKLSELVGGKRWEIKLGWSEYVDGKWSPKQLSKEHTVVPGWFTEWVKHIERISFTAKVSDQGGLKISMWNNQYIGGLSFNLPDIQSRLVASSPLAQSGPQVVHETSDDPDKYYPDFMKRTKSNYAHLELKDDVYLQKKVRHQLLFPNEKVFPENKLESPFLFIDGLRTYFVRPVGITIRNLVRYPRFFNPHIVSASRYQRDIPEFVLDDYVPGQEAAYLFAAGSPGFYRTDSLDQSWMLFSSGPGRGTTSLGLSAGSPAAAAGTAPVKSSQADAGYIGEAFGGYAEAAVLPWFLGRRDTGLEFHTFYHPYSSHYVTRLNQGGLPGLMASDTTLPSDQGSIFEDNYDPNFTHGLVQKPSDFADLKKTYYKENVCFDPYGANSQYNWELFFHAPLYIATRLSKNGRYEEAMKWFHYIFDPTTDELPGTSESEISRYWKVQPFKATPAENLEEWFKSLSPATDPNSENAIIGEWRDNPFDPHLVAANRPLAYMKHVVLKYVENLVAWADSLFRQFTRESVNEALQIYVIASHILGPRPEFVPRRGTIKAESYNSLKEKWDDFSNALVQLENIFPYSSEVSVDSTSTGPNLLGLGPALYFCIPANDRLLEYWDTVADRLFKIRHCQDIDGVQRELALFAPPISPEALIQAVSQGLSLGSILADLSSPPPIYRFTYLIQKANEFCADVKALGASLLAALEKRDAEVLSRLRASHETQILELVTAIKERQILEARAYKENLLKARETTEFKFRHFADLLGNESVAIPAAPTLESALTADSQLPADTKISLLKTGLDESLDDESGIKLISRETEELEQSEVASDQEDAANTAETIGKALYFIPEFEIATAPFGGGTLTVLISGETIGLAASAVASGLRALAAMNQYDAQRAAKLADYSRRQQGWTLEANLAAKQIAELDKQITSAEIRIQMAEQELLNHKQQIENSKEVELFLKDKFTNQELYQWMKEQLFAVHKQSYNLAYDMARKAEKAYKYERGVETADFIQYGFWDNAKQGLVAGEKLQLALRQLEKSYLEENRRELELTRSISLALVNPLALIELKETGRCHFSIPEELFDLDFQGHYFRRIKSVSLSIPCIAGPYTAVNCSLRLLKNTVRINTTMNNEGNYEHEHDEGVWVDDDRFRSNHVPVTSIATSSGQSDAGMFEFNFRDERYLPFEGAGVISDWMIELSTEKEFRQFDYSTISDVILHLRYTARESGGLFKERAVAYVKDYLTNAAELSEQPLMRLFSMKHEYPTEWHRFFHPATEDSDQVLNFTLGEERFPFFTHERDILVEKISVLARCSQSGDYHLTLSYASSDDTVVDSTPITMPENVQFGGLNQTAVNVNDAGLNLEELDISRPMSLKLKHSTAPDFKSLAKAPREVEDLFLVLHYKLL